MTKQWSNHSEPARAVPSSLQSIPTHGRGPQRKKPKATVELRTPASTYRSSTSFAAPFGGRVMNDLFAAQQRNVEAWRELSDLWVKTLEAITTQQVAAAKALTDQFTNGSGKLFGSRAPDQWGAAQAELLRAWIDTWFAQAQAVAETGCRCCIDAGHVVSERCTQAASECKAMAKAAGLSR